VELPVRISRTPLAPRVISVDGAFDAPGLNLSHWPGNQTPAALRHDLSTGAALAFARLDARERARLAAGCTLIQNNHFDTDGTCALFATRHPAAALERERAMLDAAAAGDFFRWPSDQALAIDAIVEAMVDRERSPIAAELAGLSDEARSERATAVLFERLPALLDGDLAPYSHLFEESLGDARADRADLTRASRDEIAHLDWCVWTASPDARSSRSGASAFDPGRHALFGTSPCDRALAIGPSRDGASYRLVFSTLSWFDLETMRAPPRPDLGGLAQRLNELERCDPAGAVAWRAQDAATPSPELWFGTSEHPLFAEHCAALRPSRLAPSVVRRTIADALRSALVLP
jgi:hypothetical protein